MCLVDAIWWCGAFPHIAGVAHENLVTASVTELHCFSIPQDTLVKLEAKLSNKLQPLPTPILRKRKKKNHKKGDEWASGMGEVISGFGAEERKAAVLYSILSTLGRRRVMALLAEPDGTAPC